MWWVAYIAVGLFVWISFAAWAYLQVRGTADDGEDALMSVAFGMGVGLIWPVAVTVVGLSILIRKAVDHAAQ